ncbi:MAG: sugar-binding protein [Polyangiales bacterium]
MQLSACAVYDDELLTPTRSPLRPQTVVIPDAGIAPIAPIATAAAPMVAAPAPAVLDAATPTTCPVLPTIDYCTGLPHLTAEPIIDGSPECGLALTPIAPQGWNGVGPSPNKSAFYAAAWIGEGLYVYIEVQGAPLRPHPSTAPLFCGDAVEIYVDSDAMRTDDAGMYDDSGTMQFVVAAPSAQDAPIEAGRYVQGEPAGTWITQRLKTRWLPDGYAVEALINAADIALWSWTVQQQLGFNIAIDVGGDATEGPLRCGQQLGQYFLRVAATGNSCGGEPWCDVRSFCTPTLLP